MRAEILLLAIFFVTVHYQSCSSDSQMKVELVQVLFRHGERTPSEDDYAALHYTDPTVYQPFGFGQLTTNGKKQAYNVGRLLRERYDGFLNETYYRNEIFAQSAEVDRMQNSLQLVLAGLYGSGGELEWSPDVKWNPIPYRSAPEKLDVLFRQYNSKKYRQFVNDAMKLPEVEEELNSYSDLVEFLKDKEGVTVNKTLNLLQLSSALLINSRMNIPLPSWYSEDLMSRLRELAIFFADFLTFTSEMRRAIAGPLVKTFLYKMNLDGSDNNPRKMYLYSESDYNVAAVSRALNADGFRFVDFSSTLILEKLRDSDGQLYVKLLEWDAVNEKLVDRKMKDCAEICPADDFVKICRESIPSDGEMRYLLDDFQGQDILELYIKDPLIEEK